MKLVSKLITPNTKRRTFSEIQCDLSEKRNNRIFSSLSLVFVTYKLTTL